MCCLAKYHRMIDEDLARHWWIRRLQPAGVVCPDCKVSPTGPQAETYYGGGRVHCRGCGCWYTWRTGTPLSGSSMSAGQLYAVATLITAGLTRPQIAQLTGISESTVRDWRRRLGALV